MNFTKHIPNALTCCNLLCGCLGILNMTEGRLPFLSKLFQSPLETTAYFVWAACIFDFLDGFAARALKVSSPIGKELDSLADVVSFGVLPAFMMYSLIKDNAALGSFEQKYLPILALLIAICSALRLAIFNVDETQKDSFCGLPTPANALFITALPFVPDTTFIFNPVALSIITISFSALMVSRLELFALKFKNFSWGDNKIRFTFLALAAVLIAFLGKGAIALSILLYIVLSLISKATKLA